jgi:hypothetical protein
MRVFNFGQNIVWALKFPFDLDADQYVDENIRSVILSYNLLM